MAISGREALEFVKEAVINRGGKYHGWTGKDGKLSITLHGIRYRLDMEQTLAMCQRLPVVVRERMQGLRA